MHAARLIVLSLLGRRFHSEEKHKHAHTYLQFCADDTNVASHACIHKVSARWPTPAVLDAPDCKQAAPPHDAITCAAVADAKNIYDPITIAQGLRHPAAAGGYLRGADVDTLTDWDRIRCKDGQLFATGWYKRYTPQECARLCAKISNFYGSSCTHFSRQWITSRIPEHSDTCGRDGETLAANMPAHGAYGSAGVGTGTYTYRGQCVFFNSPNVHCCSTKSGWREALSDASDSDHCQGRYGDRKDNWDSKHRSWKLTTTGFTPASGAAWPVTSAGRRLGDEAANAYNGTDAGVHEFFLPNGTRFWAVEERR